LDQRDHDLGPPHLDPPDVGAEEGVVIARCIGADLSAHCIEDGSLDSGSLTTVNTIGMLVVAYRIARNTGVPSANIASGASPINSWTPTRILSSPAAHRYSIQRFCPCIPEGRPRSAALARRACSILLSAKAVWHDYLTTSA
jgi:hypothetical protein